MSRLSYQRVEPLLLPVLRAALPGVAFRTVWDETLAAPFRQVVLCAEAGGMESPVTRSVALRVDCTVLRADGTGDWQAAMSLFDRVERIILDHGADRPLVHAEHQAGPARITADGRTSAYGIISISLAGTPAGD